MLCGLVVAAAVLTGVSIGLVTDTDHNQRSDASDSVSRQVQVNETEIVYWVLNRPFATHTSTPTATPTPTATAIWVESVDSTPSGEIL